MYIYGWVVSNHVRAGCSSASAYIHHCRICESFEEPVADLENLQSGGTYI